MQITRSLLEQRHKTFVEQRDRLAANLNACHGAIQDCEQLLTMLDTPEPEVPTAVPGIPGQEG